MSSLVAAVLCLVPQEDRGLIERLRSDSIEERVEAAVMLKKLGAGALFALERAAGDADPEVAGRVRDVLRALPKEARYWAHLERIDKASAGARLKLADYCIDIGFYEQAVFEYGMAARLQEAHPGKRAETAAVILKGARRLASEQCYKDSLETLRLLAVHYAGTPALENSREDLREVQAAIRERQAETSAARLELLRDLEELERRDFEWERARRMKDKDPH